MHRSSCFRGGTICLALVLSVLLSANAWAQSNNGSVRGTVQDQTKAVIPNVTVVLMNTDTGIETKTVTNTSGIYVFPAVSPGPYKVSAESAGMQKHEATLTVQTQQSTDLDIVLSPGSTQTVVRVEDVTPMVKTDTSTLSHTLERARIEQLWTCDASMSKSFAITERAKFRLQGDFFNVFNMPGTTPTPTNAGFAQNWQNANGPRTVQLSGRFSW